MFSRRCDAENAPPFAGKGWSRRGVLAAGLAACAGPLHADEAMMRRAITQDLGGRPAPLGNIVFDMPEFSDSGSSVPMSLHVPCAMTDLDHPRVVRVYAAENPRPRIAAFHFTPACGEARISTRVRLDSFQDVVAVAEMADGRNFQAVRRVNVTYGACEEAVPYNQFPPGWAPRIRVAVPAQAEPGALFTVRSIINHPMETGLRHGADGLLIPLRIIERFRCLADDTEVFSAKFEPAISTNPYLGFRLRLQRARALRFEWHDTTGEIYSHEAAISIG